MALEFFEKYKSEDMLDNNGVVIRNSSGKKVIRKVVVTLGGSFLEGEALVKKLKSLTNYFDSPQRKEQLRKVQDHHSIYQGSPANPGDTQMKKHDKDVPSVPLLLQWTQIIPGKD